MKRTQGFTLVEMAVVLVVIGLLLAGVVGTRALLNGAAASNTVAMVKDLGGAIVAFRERYKYLPGDMPLNGELPNMAAACAAGGNGNGQISNAESNCAMEQLFNAGLIRAPLNAAGLHVVTIPSGAGSVQIIARTDGTVPAAIRNTIPARFNHIALLRTIRCGTAEVIDNKLDDANFATGSVVGTAATCTDDVQNDPYPILGVGLL